MRGLDDLHPARDRQLVRARSAGARRRAAPRRRCPGVEPSPASRSCANTSRGGSPETSHMCAISIGLYACRWSCGAVSLASAQPAEVVLERPSRGGCPTACRSRSRRSRRASWTRRDELLARRARRRPASACPAPKPQNAQPTVQTLETLMLRLTTNVTVSPASSARSSSAAWRMSSIASGRVSANSAVSSSGVERARRRGRARSRPARARAIGRGSAARAAARDEAPVRAP